MTIQPSPQVTHASWGRIEVDGHGRFKDVKLSPGGARAWDWNETGTCHDPGVQLADVQDILDAGAEVVVLTRGMDLVLQVGPEMLEQLSGLGIETHVEQTEKAIALYNELASAGRAVGCLIHSTC